MVLTPSTTGEVLKWKVIVKLPFVKATVSAGIPFTVRSLGWTVTGSTDSLRLIMKSVGWVNTRPGQELVTEQGCASANGIAQTARSM